MTMLQAEQNFHISDDCTGRQQALEEAYEMAELEHLAQQAADLERLGKDARKVFALLTDAIRSCDDEDALSDSIEHLLSSDRLAGQFAVAAGRGAFSVAECAPGMSRVLVGLPCVVRDWPRSTSGKVAAEIQGWIRSQWLGVDNDAVQVAVSPTPVSAGLLETTVGPTLVSLTNRLATSGKAPAWMLPKDTPFVAAVWMVALTLPSSQVTQLVRRLQQDLSRDTATSTFLQRMAALAEEDGLSLRLLPPTAWANVFSRARAAAFRVQAQVYSDGHVPGAVLELQYNGTQLRTLSPASRFLSWGAYPEETRDDMETMLAHVQQATGLQIELMTEH